MFQKRKLNFRQKIDVSMQVFNQYKIKLKKILNDQNASWKTYFAEIVLEFKIQTNY